MMYSRQDPSTKEKLIKGGCIVLTISGDIVIFGLALANRSACSCRRISLAGLDLISKARSFAVWKTTKDTIMVLGVYTKKALEADKNLRFILTSTFVTNLISFVVRSFGNFGIFDIIKFFIELERQLVVWLLLYFY